MGRVSFEAFVSYLGRCEWVGRGSVVFGERFILGIIGAGRRVEISGESVDRGDVRGSRRRCVVLRVVCRDGWWRTISRVAFS